MPIKKILVLLGGLILVAVLFAACGPATEVPQVPENTEAPEVPAATEVAPVEISTHDISVEPETCGICHKDAGEKHQASYDELYQDGVILVKDITYKFTSNPDTTVVTFKMTKNGEPISGAAVENLNIYFTAYTGTDFERPARLALKGKLTYDAAKGVTTSTLVEKDPSADGYIDYSDVKNVDGLITVFGRDETVGTLPERINQVKYPYAAFIETGKGVNYTSAANASGCENCHSQPFLKHGYIYGEVDHDPSTDFYICKSCHLDNGNGGHVDWQILADDPELAAAYRAGDVQLTDEQKAQYAYKTTLMNDVHMSHAMEFPYPQSMSNCVTCHEGKLDVVLSDENMTAVTCKSCHPVNGAKAEGENPAYDTTKFALNTIIPHGFDETATCTECHGEDKVAPAFNQIHSGYNNVIFTADGTKYSDAVVVIVDSASFADNKLTFAFSATSTLEGIDVSSITPTVLVGLYGYDTKDFIIGPHERLTDDNGDGTIDNKDARATEFKIGDESPRFTTNVAADGKWEVTADLSTWADMIADGTVKRVEIGLLPTLKNADGVTLALNAPSRTFDLGKNDFDDKFYSPIIKVTDGCNTCHAALATTFHSPDRGGNTVVCRMCHIVKSGGSHLEVQSRSLDSYVHAIHAFQAFDIGDIDFSDPVQAMEYDDHIEFPFPRHGLTDCESCHVEGSFNVPDQAQNLPGILSSSDVVEGRNISDVPSYVVGPATRACGSCHRAHAINEDSAGELEMLFQHWRQGGYMIEAGDDPTATLNTVIEQVMTLFK